MEATDNEPRSLEDFAESLLVPSQDEGAQDEETEAPDEDQTEVEEAEADEDTEASDDDDESEDEDDDDSEDEGDEQPQKLKVKVDGQEVEVTLDDLKRSYSGQAYIQQRMQEVAEARKMAETVYSALAEERAQVAQFVQQLQQGVPTPPKAPSQELARKDPARYNRELGQYLADREKYDQFTQHAQALTAQQSEAQERAMRAYLADQAQLLTQEIPEFADPDKGSQLRQSLLKVGSEYGYSEEELAQITDARAVKVLNDARKWRELQAGKKAAIKKADKARPVVKPGAKRTNIKTDARKKAKQRLQQTGKIDDAIDLLFQ